MIDPAGVGSPGAAYRRHSRRRAGRVLSLPAAARRWIGLDDTNASATRSTSREHRFAAPVRLRRGQLSRERDQQVGCLSKSRRRLGADVLRDGRVDGLGRGLDGGRGPPASASLDTSLSAGSRRGRAAPRDPDGHRVQRELSRSAGPGDGHFRSSSPYPPQQHPTRRSCTRPSSRRWSYRRVARPGRGRSRGLRRRVSTRVARTDARRGRRSRCRARAGTCLPPELPIRRAP
jgi:hypothetical protein